MFLGDLFGSSYIVNGASDVWGVIKDTDSAEPKFKLKVLKPRSGITEAGDTFELLGCREDLSLTLSAHNGDEKGVEKARGQALLVLNALQGRNEETALELAEISQLTGGHPTAVSKVLKVLVGEKHPGLKRVPIKSGKAGRPSYRYWVEVEGVEGEGAIN